MLAARRLLAAKIGMLTYPLMLCLNRAITVLMGQPMQLSDRIGRRMKLHDCSPDGRRAGRQQ